MIAGVVFITPFFVSAQAVTDQFTQNTQVQNSCVDLKYNMAYRSRDVSTNGEVSDLQDFLVTNGYLSGDPTGYFGLTTLTAVKKFQSAVGVGSPTTPGYGGVGPKSRAKIKAMTCGVGTTTTTPISTTTTTPQAPSISPSSPPSPGSKPPEGCASFAGYSTLTGNRCFPLEPGSTILPAGCTSAIGFSSLTGQSCSVTTPTTVTTSSVTVNIQNVVQYGADTSSAFITTSVGASSQNKQVTAWNLQISCPASVSYLMPNKTDGFGASLCGTTQKYNSSDYYDITRGVVVLTAGATNTSGVPSNITYLLTAYDASGRIIGSDSKSISLSVPPVVATTTTTTGIPPTVEFIGAPTLSLQYDSVGKESMLVGKATVKITAGNTPMYNTDSVAGILQFNNSATGRVNSNSGTFNAASVGLCLPAMRGCVIPANGSLTYNITETAKTSELFSGSYSSKPAVFSWSDSNNNYQGVPFSSFKNLPVSNSVTIIGETSPYITGVGSDAVSGGAHIISGVRFNPTSNQVTINGTTKTLPISLQPTPTQSQINFMPADFGITSTGNYVVQVSASAGASNKFYTNINVSTTTTSAPVVKVTGTSALKLGYDGANKEASLIATYNVNVTAPSSSDFKVYKYGVFDSSTYAFLVTLNNAHDANSSTVNPTYYLVSGNAVDNGTYWDISAGQTASFSLTATLSNPKTLFAGSYNATLSTYKPAGGAGVTASVMNGTTNSVTIIGETSPYISSGTVDAYGTIRLTGARLDIAGNQVAIDGNIFVDGTKGDATTMSFGASTYNLSNGAHFIQINNLQTGNSNTVYVNVASATATAPKVSGIAVIGAQASYPAGVLVKFSVKGVVTDGTSAGSNRGFNVQSSMRMLDPIQTYLPVYVNGVAQSFNANYNQGTGLWDVVMTAPSDTTKTYDVDTAVYCANSAQGCQSGQLNTGFRFNVTAPTTTQSVVTVTSPNSGEIWTKGTLQTVAWMVTNNPKNHIIVLKLFKSGVFFQNLVSPAGTITTGPYGSTGGSLPWTVPVTLPDGADYTIQVTDYDVDSVTLVSQDSSNSTFSIVAATATTTLPAPVITSATTINATQADAQNYIVSWQAVSGATTYKMKIDSLAVQDIGYTTSWGFNVKAGLPTSLSTVGTHLINIQACNNTVCSGWSNTVTENVAASIATITTPVLKTVEPTSQNVASNTAGMKMGSFTVTAGGDNIRVKTVNVTIGLNGYSMTNLSNLVIKSGGIILGTPLGSPSLINPQVFSFFPVDISSNQAKTFDVYADVGSASSGFASVIISIGYINTVSGVEGTLNANAGAITTTASTVAGVQQPNQSQLASVIGAFAQAPRSAPAPVWAYTWARNLEVNSPYTADVSALQTALTKEGVYEGDVTGGFYTQTYLAVKKFQAKYGIESTGFVGPSTRAKLNELYR